MAREKQSQRIQNTKIKKEQILERCKGICTHCGKKLVIGEEFTVEHVIPLSKGGTNDFDNLVALCESCNKEKGNDIVDADFYSFAPKVLYEVIEENLREYYENNDWLTRTNIFRTDRFTVPVTKTLRLKNGKIIEKEATSEVRKISDEEANAFFQRYSDTYFGEIGREEFGGQESAAPVSDVYQIRYKDKSALLFVYSLFTEPEAALCLRIFVNPDINLGPAARIILAQSLTGIVGQFRDSLEARGTKAAVTCYIDAMAPDKKGVALIEDIGTGYWKNGVYMESPNSENKYGTVYTMTFVGESVMDVAEQSDADAMPIISAEDMKRQEKLYRSQLKRRLKQNAQCGGAV